MESLFNAARQGNGKGVLSAELLAECRLQLRKPIPMIDMTFSERLGYLAAKYGGEVDSFHL